MSRFTKLPIRIFRKLLLVLPLGMLLGAGFAAEVVSIEILELAGRPGHQGYWPTEGQPTTDKIIVLAKILGEPQTAELKVDGAGGTLLQVPMARVGENDIEYVVEFDTPNEAFTLSVVGMDEQGAMYSGDMAKPLHKSNIALNLSDAESYAFLGSTYTFNVILKNLAENDTFTLQISNNLGLPVANSIQSIPIEEGEEKIMEFEIDVAEAIDDFSMMELVAEVTSQTDVNNTNKKSETVTILDEKHATLTIEDTICFPIRTNKGASVICL